MKNKLSKYISGLLLGSMLLSGCTQNPDNQSSDASAYTEQSAPQAVQSDMLISKNCPYSFNYSLFDGKTEGLTDGIFASTPSSTDSAFVGIRADGVSVTLDLLASTDNIKSISVSYLVDNEKGISEPDKITFQTSLDGESWSESFSPSKNGGEGNGIYKTEYVCREEISARYVKFDFSTKDSLTYIDELCVYTKPAEKTSVYKDAIDSALKTAPSEEALRQNTESIKSKISVNHNKTNVSYINGSRYSISGVEYKKGPLTDGKREDRISESATARVTPDKPCEIVVSLSGIKTDVSSLTLSAVSKENSGIYLPTYVDFEASANGKDYIHIGRVYVDPNCTDSVYTYRLELDCCIRIQKARFKVAPTNNSDMYISEIAVSSKRGIVSINEYATSDLLSSGAKDISLIYYSYKDFTTEDFYGYTAYIKDGKIVDTMFDSFLFLPNPGHFFGYGYPTGNSTIEGWLALMDHLFLENKNLDALNKVAGEVKEELNIPDYKYKFFISIPYPSSGVSDFGDVDGDGKTEDMSSRQTRIKVVKWYIDRFYKMFDPAKYPNIEFAGWYWFQESLGSSDIQVSKAASDHIKTKDYGTDYVWIPYFKAAGYQYWKDAGFDVACMQPNYFFNLYTPESNLHVNAELTKQLGMCVEFEFDSRAKNDKAYYDRYILYLKTALEYGYDDAIHFYYEGGGFFQDVKTDKSRYGRSVYDYTYLFIKGKLNEHFFSGNSIKCSVDKSMKLSVISGARNMLMLESPKNGTVTFDEKGTAFYTPNSGFRGTDSVTFVCAGQPDAITLNITVS